MRVALVNSSVSRQAGGVFFSVRRLAQTFAASGDCDVDVLGIEDSYTGEDVAGWAAATPKVFRHHGPAAFGYAPAMGRWLRESDDDLAHTQGLWMYPSLAVQRWSRRSGRPYLVSPHGMLDPWAVRNSGLKKRLAGWAYEHSHLRGAACLHALCDAEAKSIRDFGLRNPICVIPNGVDLPESTSTAPPWAANLPAGSRVLLYLGRLHPKKGLSGLLEAWSRARYAADGAGWHLVVAGWDQGGYQAQLTARVKHAGLQNQVHFVGPQFGAEKTASYERADGFVLPSFSEGLPMTVLEAWSHGLPVVMTAACNLPEGFSTGAALETATSPDAIAATLAKLFRLPEADRSAMGAKGRRLVIERFTWTRVAKEMVAVYRWILGNGTMPETVVLD